MAKIISKKLNMTLEQMETEILTMRAFDQFMRNGFGDQYEEVCKMFAKELTALEWENIDPKFAEEIRNGLLDDNNEVLS